MRHFYVQHKNKEQNVNRKSIKLDEFILFFFLSIEKFMLEIVSEEKFTQFKF